MTRCLRRSRPACTPKKKELHMSRIQLPRLSRIAIASFASATLISAAFIAPSPAFAAPNSNGIAVAATQQDNATNATAVFDNDPAGTTDPISSSLTGGGTLSHMAQLKANSAADGSGTESVSNRAGGGTSILRRDLVKKLDYVLTVTNNSSAATDINEAALLPKSQKADYDGQWSTSADESGFDSNGLKDSQISGSLTDQSITYSASGNKLTSWDDFQSSNQPGDLEEIKITGQLAANDTMTITIPLTIPSADLADPTFSFAEASSVGGALSTPTSEVTVATPLTAPDGSNLIPFTGNYVATTQSTDASGKTTYTTVPSLQQFMPKAENGTNYWVNNFDSAKIGGTTDTKLYPKGNFRVDFTSTADAVKSHGYALRLWPSGDAITDYDYSAASLSATVVNPDGSTYAPTATQDAPYIALRPVVTGTDTTIASGSTFDAKTDKGLNLHVYDHAGKDVDLSSSDVVIDASAVNTAKAGSYPVTVTYTPDGVSNSFTVNVAAAVTPAAPTQAGDTVTIPTTSGVDYQLNGKIVTGDITLADGQAITITAAAQSGYVIADGATTSWDFSYNAPTTPAPTPGESGSSTPGEGAGGQAGSGQGGTGSEVKTSGTGSAADLAGLGIALAATGAGAAAVARKIRRNRR